MICCYGLRQLVLSCVLLYKHRIRVLLLLTELSLSINRKDRGLVTMILTLCKLQIVANTQHNQAQPSTS